jgi:hypothetical protein
MDASWTGWLGKWEGAILLELVGVDDLQTMARSEAAAPIVLVKW